MIGTTRNSSGQQMTVSSEIPPNGLDKRKYAAICLALARARGALFDAMHGDLDDAREIYNGTALSKLALALGCREGDLAIDWNDHLTPTEIDRIEGR